MTPAGVEADLEEFVPRAGGSGDTGEAGGEDAVEDLEANGGEEREEGGNGVARAVDVGGVEAGGDGVFNLIVIGGK